MDRDTVRKHIAACVEAVPRSHLAMAKHEFDEQALDEFVAAINVCQRDACRVKYRHVCEALSKCECGKPQQFLGDNR